MRNKPQTKITHLNPMFVIYTKESYGDVVVSRYRDGFDAHARAQQLAQSAAAATTPIRFYVRKEA